MITLAPPEEEGWKDGEERTPPEADKGAQECTFFFLRLFLCFISLRRAGEEEKGKPYYDGRAPWSFAEDCRNWSKSCKIHTLNLAYRIGGEARQFRTLRPSTRHGLHLYTWSGT